MTNMIQTEGKWEKRGDSFVASFRFAGERGDVSRHVGKTAKVRAKSGKVEFVTLSAIVEDFGEGDVTLFAVER